VTTLIPVIDRLRRRFDIARVCVVADRGMISAETMAELEARGLLYILGVRERTDKLVHRRSSAVRAAGDDEARQRDRLRGQDGDAGGAALHRLPQPSGGGEGCRRPGLDCGRAGAPARQGRQGADRQHRLSTLPEDDQRPAFRDRSRQDRGGEEARRHLRAAHQHRSQPARGHALLQAAVDGGADLPYRQARPHPLALLRARCDRPRCDRAAKQRYELPPLIRSPHRHAAGSRSAARRRSPWRSSG
jgi:Transposase DDE domain